MKILKDIWKLITGFAKKVKEVLSKGNEIANTIKTVVDSPLLDVVTRLTPTDIDDKALAYLRSKLPVWIYAMGWADKKLSDFDSTTLPHVMNAINAETSKLIADFNNVELTRPQAIASAQIVYNPEIINV